MYQVVYGGDPGASGIWNYKGDKLLISDWALRKWHYTDAATVAQFSQKRIAAIVREHAALTRRLQK